MQVLAAAALCVGAYLYASINLAVLLARAVRGIDVRSVGPGTAGTANTARALGRGWAFLVFLFDLSKSVGPLLVGRLLLFPGPGWEGTVALFLAAAAAILGHCRPLFFGFRGGGGVVTAMGAFFFFVPVEFFLSMLAGFLAVQVFLPRARFKIGQWTPIVFLVVTPVVTLVAGLLVDVPILGRLHFGGTPWYVAAGTLALGLVILAMNPLWARERAREAVTRARSNPSPRGSPPREGQR
jgi:acyl phosphate:glycerol-3-phosphate acyltransferase